MSMVSVVSVARMHVLQLALPDELAGTAVLLLIHRTLLCKLAPSAEQELHGLGATLGLGISGGTGSFRGTGGGRIFLGRLRNATRDNGLHIIIHPRQIH